MSVQGRIQDHEDPAQPLRIQLGWSVQNGYSRARCMASLFQGMYPKAWDCWSITPRTVVKPSMEAMSTFWRRLVLSVLDARCWRVPWWGMRVRTITITGDSLWYFTFISFPTIFALHHFICTSTKYFICDCWTGPYLCNSSYNTMPVTLTPQPSQRFQLLYSCPCTKL